MVVVVVAAGWVGGWLEGEGEGESQTFRVYSADPE